MVRCSDNGGPTVPSVNWESKFSSVLCSLSGVRSLWNFGLVLTSLVAVELLIVEEQ